MKIHAIFLYVVNTNAAHFLNISTILRIYVHNPAILLLSSFLGCQLGPKLKKYLSCVKDTRIVWGMQWATRSDSDFMIKWLFAEYHYKL